MTEKQHLLFNERQQMDGLVLLNNINDVTISCAFFDPQYRGVLDHLSYGNEGARQKGRAALPQMDENTIIKFIGEIDRVLKPSGHLFLWLDKYHLCSGGADRWLSDTDLQIVDMIVWDKGKIGMGYRTRRKSEYLLVLQKKPIKAKAVWTDHGIPDVWPEKVTKAHPHSKPIELQARLIKAVTKEGDIVLDPAAGGFSVLEACKLAKRDFLGCDITYKK